MKELSERREYNVGHSSGMDNINSWKENISDVYYDLDVKRNQIATISGSLEKRIFSDVSVSSYRGTPHNVFRTKQMVRNDRAEQHVFVFPLAGNFDLRQRGKEVKATAGTMYVVNAAEPYDVDMYNDAHMVAVSLPCDISRMTFAGIDDRCCELGLGDPILIETMTSFVRSVLRSDADADPFWLRKVCCDLIDAMIHPRHGGAGNWSTSVSARRFLLDAMRKTIQERMHEQGFGIADAAAACQVSTRHLQYALHDVGSTFSEELAEARLQRAARLLRSASRGPKRVGQIAYECGFRSQAHFSTRYKERFGLAPKNACL